MLAVVDTGTAAWSRKSQRGGAGSDGDGCGEASQILDGGTGEVELAAQVTVVVQDVGRMEEVVIGAVEDVSVAGARIRAGSCRLRDGAGRWRRVGGW